MRACNLIRLLVLCAAAALVFPGATSAATFTVTKAADTNDGACDDDCSLREAVRAANAASGADQINLPARRYLLTISGSGENSAATGDLDIAGDLAIRGAGARGTIVDASGFEGDPDRAFEVIRGAAGLAGLTVTGGDVDGDHGGGLASTATGARGVALAAVTFRNNEASGSGGAVYIRGVDLAVVSSTFADNGASSEAAINVGGGETTIVNSTLTRNEGHFAGAFQQNGGTTTILNSTISFNFSNAFEGEESSSTGGIANGEGNLRLKNTIVSGNRIRSNNALDNCRGSITSQGHNLEDGTDCGFTASGDLQKNDPKLGPLANNGGQTDTRTLQSGSPAIDAGTNSGCPSEDQRGVARPQNETCDIGAVEILASEETTPEGGVDTGAGPGDSGGSRLWAVGAAAVLLALAGVGLRARRTG